MPTLEVRLADGESASPRSYAIVVEPGALASLGSRVRDVAPHSRALLAVDAAIADSHGAHARASLERAGFDVAEVRLRAREEEKSLDTVRSIYEAMLGHRLERSTPLIAMGGGIVGDTAGFAAATFLRGLPLIHVPTTLLAMVDASIGGKTGVNIPVPLDSEPTDAGPESSKVQITLGKNLVGAFYQPRLILSDPEVLTTLDARSFTCGLAESLKHAIIADRDLLAFITDCIDSIAAREMSTLAALIERSARVKIGIVERDERESGERALLNLGHTFAHAIESMPKLALHHGEAVSIGLIAASFCSHRLLMMDEEEFHRVKAAVAACELPTRLTAHPRAQPLVQAMRFDKKVERGRLRLILPRSIGRCEIVPDVPEAIIEEAWHEVGAQ